MRRTSCLLGGFRKQSTNAIAMREPTATTFREGQVVVITGASAGLGRSLVREFARQRARIGLLARNREGLEAAQLEVAQLGGQALVVPTDVANWQQLETAAQRVEAVFGPIDIWINNASVSLIAPFTTLQADEIRRVTEVAYLGSVYGTQVALRRMIDRQQGHIVLISDQGVSRGIRFQTAYAGAKAGLKGFYDSLQQELAGTNGSVGVSLVHLPTLNTPRHTLLSKRTFSSVALTGPVYQPAAAARAIARAASGSGQEYFVGLTALPNAKQAARFRQNWKRWFGESEQPLLTESPQLVTNESVAQNLWKPIPGDHGAQGRYDKRARQRAISVQLKTYRAAGTAALVGLLLGAAALLSRRGTNNKDSRNENP